MIKCIWNEKDYCTYGNLKSWCFCNGNMEECEYWKNQIQSKVEE